MGQLSREQLTSLQRWVADRYRSSGLSEPVVEKLTFHNGRVLSFTEAIADGEGLEGPDRELLITIAVLHDAAKAEVPLLEHAEAGAELAREKLAELGCDEAFVAAVARGIECHMGPIPFIAEEVRKHRERTGQDLDPPRPQTRIEKLFYDADMLTLIDVHGVEKIVALRSTTDDFISEDERTADEEGISPTEAAYRSALESVHRAAATLFSDTARSLAGDLVAEAERHVAGKIGAARTA